MKNSGFPMPRLGGVWSPAIIEPWTIGSGKSGFRYGAVHDFPSLCAAQSFLRLSKAANSFGGCTYSWLHIIALLTEKLVSPM